MRHFFLDQSRIPMGSHDFRSRLTSSCRWRHNPDKTVGEVLVSQEPPTVPNNCQMVCYLTLFGLFGGHFIALVRRVLSLFKHMQGSREQLHWQIQLVHRSPGEGMIQRSSLKRSASSSHHMEADRSPEGFEILSFWGSPLSTSRILG